MTHFFGSFSLSSVSFRQAFALACVYFCTSVLTAAHGNEPTALEIRQMQTRIFKKPPNVVNSALMELCISEGGQISPGKWDSYPKHFCNPRVRIGRTSKFHYTISKEKDGSALVRVELFERIGNGDFPLRASEEHDFFFKSLADMLVLNEMGVEIKVFR